jgi:hypothetical protein
MMAGTANLRRLDVSIPLVGHRFDKAKNAHLTVKSSLVDQKN